MGQLIKKVKKPLLLAFAVITITILFYSTLSAQTTGEGETQTIEGCNSGQNSDQYLYCIMQNTYGTLVQVNNLPVYLDNLTKLAYSWLTQDDSAISSTLQTGFSSFASTILADITAQNALQPQLMQDLLTGATTTTLPYANDLTYPTLLNMPFFAKDPRNPNNVTPPPFNAPYNYIKNASGINILHVMPSTTWSGRANDQAKYNNMYNTQMAVESFGGYVLSNLYAEYSNGNGLTTLQNNLLTQASGSDWFTQVASERIGIVLRQILMFESQVYVLLTQLLSVEKQLLSAHVMTNSMLVVLNQSNEQIAQQKASGAPPAA